MGRPIAPTEPHTLLLYDCLGPAQGAADVTAGYKTWGLRFSTILYSKLPKHFPFVKEKRAEPVDSVLHLYYTLFDTTTAY